MTSKVYELVTDKIITVLEQGTPPWRKPWTAGIPRNAITNRPYSGINALLLGMTTYSDPPQIHAG
jgi:antirestriction protein ArdC